MLSFGPMAGSPIAAIGRAASNSFAYPGSGGAQAGGSGTVVAHWSLAGAGSAQAGGAAQVDVALSYVYQGQGGAQSGGAADTLAGWLPSATGGAQTGGTAALATTHRHTGAGAAQSGGLAEVAHRTEVNVNGSGGLQTGGASDLVAHWRVSGSGGAQAGGAAEVHVVRANAYAAQGGGVCGGTRPGCCPPHWSRSVGRSPGARPRSALDVPLRGAFCGDVSIVRAEVFDTTLVLAEPAERLLTPLPDAVTVVVRAPDEALLRAVPEDSTGVVTPSTTSAVLSDAPVEETLFSREHTSVLESGTELLSSVPRREGETEVAQSPDEDPLVRPYPTRGCQ